MNNQSEAYTSKDVDRFWKYVTPGNADDCWEWQGGLNVNGYARMLFAGNKLLVHRVSYLIHNKFIDPNLFVLHSCHNRRCVNPSHLRQGTNQDNMDDMIKANRQSSKVGEKNPKRKLTEEQVREIRTLYPNSSGPKLGRQFGVSTHQIWMIVNRKNWTHI